jgi:hypothetical protein
MRVLEVRASNIKSLLGPLDGVVGLGIKLLAKLLNERSDLSCALRAINVSHWQVDHSAVAPITTRVEGSLVREKPKLWQDSVDSVPFVYAKCGEPELAPMRYSSSTSKLVHSSSSTNATRIRGREANQSKRYIVEPAFKLSVGRSNQKGAAHHLTSTTNVVPKQVESPSIWRPQPPSLS